MTATRFVGWVLALSASAASVCMSVIASWQRGGLLAERIVWVAIGVVLVGGAHLFPALARHASPGSSRRGARLSGSVTIVVWLACMVTACYGHVTFFLLAQRHAADERVASVIEAAPAPPRTLTAVTADLAQVTERLAFLRARPCQGQCALWEARQTSLIAKQEALMAEADDVRRWMTEHDRTSRRRDRVMTDPVTAALALMFGMTTDWVEVVTCVGFAVVLECLAGLLWWIALADAHLMCPPSEAVVVAETALAPASNEPASAETDSELDLVSREVSAGRLRPTVTEIRQFLRCSQSKAASLRRELVGPT